jgi:hypothetical protein
MPEKKKKEKKEVKGSDRDLKARKDAKGGGIQFARASQTASPTDATHTRH